MTPPVATADEPKRAYRGREVLPRKCDKCGTRGKVNGYDRDANGKYRSDLRRIKCPNPACQHSWKQRPE